MLKTNNELLKEKIAYADEKIKKYKAKIEAISDLIYCNRTIIDNLLFKRTKSKVILDYEKNISTILKSNDEISDYEKSLKEENVKLAIELEKLEDKLIDISSTRKNLQSILDGKKKQKGQKHTEKTK